MASPRPFFARDGQFEGSNSFKLVDSLSFEMDLRDKIDPEIISVKFTNSRKPLQEPIVLTTKNIIDTLADAVDFYGVDLTIASNVLKSFEHLFEVIKAFSL